FRCLKHELQIKHDVLNLCWRAALLTAAQLKAARALVGMEQKALSQASGVSLPTIQRMEASNGTVRGVIESLTKVMAALEAAGIEFINEGAPSSGGGRGVRLRRRAEYPATFSDGLRAARVAVDEQGGGTKVRNRRSGVNDEADRE